jgi:hypothetical protein
MTEMARGRSPARKGQRAEQELVRLLLEYGLVCVRVPLSSAAGSKFTEAIHLELRGRTSRVEVKARRQFRTLQAWLAHADLLLLKADQQLPLVVLPLPLFAEIAKVRP